MLRPATTEKKPIRSLVMTPSHVVRRRTIRFNPSPISISYPMDGCESNLVVHRENGVVKSLEYRCKCGHTDKFICE
jgi:hypothetical protein